MMASLLRVPGVDRLGLAEVFGEHERTLYRLDDHDGRHARVADYIVLYLAPLVLGVACGFAGVRLATFGPVLNGVAIIVGGLFAFLAMLFGIQTLGSASAGMTPAVRTLIRETRANVSYAIVTSLVLIVFTMLAESLRAVAEPGKSQAAFGVVVSAVAIAAMAHLVLILLMVLNRVRLAFSKLA